MTTTSSLSLADQIRRLKAERKAVILAHNYQVGDVQDIADFVGDSLALSRHAAASSAPVIVFCGVHFMAETAAILCPEKTVLLPDLEAGCSLAATIDAAQLRAWKNQNPNRLVVAYVNSSAEVKAEADVCCTSSNAVNVVESLPSDKEILFVPDMYLGQFVREKTGRKIQLWPGSCHVHYKLRDEDITQAKREHPGAECLVHPECGCLSSALKLADHVCSTGGMMKRVRESAAKEFLVATETGILHTMRKENPDKRFIPVLESARCEFMKIITLEKVLWSLQDMKHRVKVPEHIATRARKAIDRMVEVPA